MLQSINLEVLLLFIVFWLILFSLGTYLEREISKQRSTPISFALLNLLDTFIILSLGFLYLLNELVFGLASLRALAPFAFLMAMAFYLVDPIFQIIRAKIDLPMIMHHLIAIGGLSWMVSFPDFYLVTIVLLVTTKLTFQFYLNSLIWNLNLKSDRLLRMSAWWNWNLFWSIRILLVPLLFFYINDRGGFTFLSAMFFSFLTFWGWYLLPRVWNLNKKYLKVRGLYSFWERLLGRKPVLLDDWSFKCEGVNKQLMAVLMAA